MSERRCDILGCDQPGTVAGEYGGAGYRPGHQCEPHAYGRRMGNGSFMPRPFSFQLAETHRRVAS